jgi:hypothetical protein
VRLGHFAAEGAEAALLSSSDPDAKPLLERREDFVRDLPVRVRAGRLACTLPPHSVAFITLHAR